MGKKYDTPELAAAAFGVGKLKRHMLVCIGPDCIDPEAGDATWQYVKRRMKELNIAGADGPCYRTKCQCLRICTGGPVAGGDPEGPRDWRVPPEDAGGVLQPPLPGGGGGGGLFFW